jgi:hypothetical protein
VLRDILHSHRRENLKSYLVYGSPPPTLDIESIATLLGLLSEFFTVLQIVLVLKKEGDTDGKLGKMAQLVMLLTCI